MIVSCPECNGKVSSTVPNCPHCGFIMKPPDPDSVEALEAERVPCPYCGELILLAATICPRCRGPVIQGKAVHPAHRPAKRVAPVIEKSFISYAVICMLLYLLCWPLSLILNIMWFAEAKAVENEIGREPDGKGCLFVMLFVGVVFLALIIVGIVVNAGH